MIKKILIVGKSALAQAVRPMCDPHMVKIVGRPEYDLAQEQDCKQLVLDHALDTDCVVFTQGTMSENIWNSITVNYTSTVYLMSLFYKTMHTKQIIAVSSATVNWQSWPKIDMSRMIYACAKAGVSEFGKNLNRKNIPGEQEKDVSIQIYEPNAFASKMSNSTHSITDAAKELRQLIENPRISVLQGLNR